MPSTRVSCWAQRQDDFWSCPVETAWIMPAYRRGYLGYMERMY